MKSHPISLKPALTAAAFAVVSMLALLAIAGSPAAAAKPKVYECQHPLITGQEAVNPKGITPKEACKVVLSLGKFLSKPGNIEALYECKGATPKMPGRPKLLLSEFEGWKLKLVNGYNFFMTKPGQSFRVTGTDFPVNCS